MKLSARVYAEQPATRTVASLETGLLPAYRGLVVYWALYWLLISPAVWLATGNPGVLEPWQYALLAGIQVAALLLLSSRRARLVLGRSYLPAVVGVTTMSFFVEKAWFLALGTAPDAAQGELLHAFAVRQDFALLLLILAWQYRFRYAALYALTISAAEWLLVARADTPDQLGSVLNANMLLTRVAVYLLLGFLVTRLMRRQRGQRRALKLANQQLQGQADTIERLTLSRERNRLARELHDTLAHSLSTLSVQLEAIRALWDHDPEAAKRMLAQADTTTRTGLTEARRSLSALRSSPLDDLGLVGALRDLAHGAAERAGTDLELALPTTLSFPAATEQGVYRVAQEALENVVRHARARKLGVTLELQGTSLVLTVRDDGCGFDPGRVAATRHFGLRGIKERAAMLAATLDITSRPGEGVCLTLAVPR